MRAALLPLAALLTLAAAAPPAPWEATRAQADAEDVPAATYRVRPGETLSHVVAHTGAGADAIARANRLEPPFRLRPGQQLAIPAGRYHRVRTGETGIAIAHAYGVDWGEVTTLNHLEPPFVLRAGERLLLPPARPTGEMTLEQRAAAFRIDLDDLVTGSEPALPRKGKAAPPRARPAAPLPPTIAVAPPAESFAGRFGWPLVGRTLRRFGALPDGGRNDGIDIAAPGRAPILAAADGAVAWAGAYPAFGQVILLTHGSGWATIYGRVGDLLVTRGQKVARGQPIGRAAGPLHFEIRSGRRPIDPLALLRGSAANGVSARP